MRLVVRPEALAEILEAQQWYEARAPGLGYDFARAVDVATQAAVRSPQAHPLLAEKYRRVILRRFPYSLIYSLRGDVITSGIVLYPWNSPLAGGWSQ